MPSPCSRGGAIERQCLGRPAWGAWEDALITWTETDRRPTRKIWFGSLDDTVEGLDLRGRVQIKPFLLRTGPERWSRVDVEEVLYLEARDGRVDWFTVRGCLPDLDSPHLDAALARALKRGVFARISPRHAVAAARIRGLEPDGKGAFLLETEGPSGEGALLPMERSAMPAVEECLEAMSLGGGFLMLEADEDREDS